MKAEVFGDIRDWTETIKKNQYKGATRIILNELANSNTVKFETPLLTAHDVKR